LKSCCVLQDHYDDERNKTVFFNTTPDLQDQDRFFLVSDWYCPKTDGLRAHHQQTLVQIMVSRTSSVAATRQEGRPTKTCSRVPEKSHFPDRHIPTFITRQCTVFV